MKDILIGFTQHAIITINEHIYRIFGQFARRTPEPKAERNEMITYVARAIYANAAQINV